jgi:hypothetical protein
MPFIMKSEALIAHVPPRIATLVKARARDRQLSTSRYLTKLIEREVEPEEEEGMAYGLEDLQRIIEETDAECLLGKRKVYSHTDEFIRDLDEYARKQKV